jgi:hypothetical protein
MELTTLQPLLQLQSESPWENTARRYPLEAADIVLLVDDISRVGDAMAISGRMRRIALQTSGRRLA